MNKKDKELENLEVREEKIMIQNKELIQNVNSQSIEDLNKNKKTSEKKVHNLNKNLTNCRDSISHLKSEMSTQKIRDAKVQKDARRRKKQIGTEEAQESLAAAMSLNSIVSS